MTATQLPSSTATTTTITTSNVSTIIPSNINLSTTTNCDTTIIPQSTVVVSSSSSLLSSTSALAKFNRIIDNTMPATNYYSRKKSKDSTRPSSNNPKQQTQQEANVLSSKIKNDINIPTSSTITTTTTTMAGNNHYTTNNTYNNYYSPTNDNQTKRNDVHYLLKQLNSFSDIEEIEIVELHRSNNHHHPQTKTQTLSQHPRKRFIKTSTATATASSATPTSSLSNKSSPTSVSHKIRYSDWSEGVQVNVGEIDGYGYGCDLSSDEHIHSRLLLPQQYDDYIFQSCHYLETSCFATTITTAIAGSSSHEFRPSNSTSAASSNSSNAKNKIRSPITTAKATDICNPSPPLPSPISQTSTLIHQTSTSTTTTTTIAKATAITYCTTSRVSGSEIIRTELSTSPSSSSSIAKNGGYSSESNGSGERRAPFFKCCYTPLDRWREKRHAAAGNNSSTGVTTSGSGNRSTHNVTGETHSQNQQRKTGLGHPV